MSSVTWSNHGALLSVDYLVAWLSRIMWGVPENAHAKQSLFSWSQDDPEADLEDCLLQGCTGLWKAQLSLATSHHALAVTYLSMTPW